MSASTSIATQPRHGSSSSSSSSSANTALVHPVQGLIVTSLDSGILLFHEEVSKGFGMVQHQGDSQGGTRGPNNDNSPVDPYQLASSLFALYNNSVFFDANSNSKKGFIKSVKKGNQLIQFASRISDNMGESFLVTIFSSKGISLGYSQSLMENVLRAVSEAHISTLSSPRPSAVKLLRSTIGTCLSSSFNSSDLNTISSSNVNKNFEEFYSPEFLQSEGFRLVLDDVWVYPTITQVDETSTSSSSGGFVGMNSGNNNPKTGLTAASSHIEGPGGRGSRGVVVNEGYSRLSNSYTNERLNENEHGKGMLCSNCSIL